MHWGSSMGCQVALRYMQAKFVRPNLPWPGSHCMQLLHVSRHRPCC